MYPTLKNDLRGLSDMLSSLVGFGAPLDRMLLLETLDEGEIRTKSFGELFSYCDMPLSLPHDAGAIVAGLEQSVADPTMLAPTGAQNASGSSEQAVGHVPFIEEPENSLSWHGLSLEGSLMTQEEEIFYLPGAEQSGSIDPGSAAVRTSPIAGVSPVASALRIEDCVDPAVLSVE